MFNLNLAMLFAMLVQHAVDHSSTTTFDVLDTVGKLLLIVTVCSAYVHNGVSKVVTDLVMSIVTNFVTSPVSSGVPKIFDDARVYGGHLHNVITITLTVAAFLFVFENALIIVGAVRSRLLPRLAILPVVHALVVILVYIAFSVAPFYWLACGHERDNNARLTECTESQRKALPSMTIAVIMVACLYIVMVACRIVSGFVQLYLVVPHAFSMAMGLLKRTIARHTLREVQPMVEKVENMVETLRNETDEKLMAVMQAVKGEILQDVLATLARQKGEEQPADKAAKAAASKRMHTRRSS